MVAAALAGAVAGAVVAGSIAIATDDDNAGSVQTAPAASNSSATPERLDVGAVLDRVQPAVVSVQTESLGLNDLLMGSTIGVACPTASVGGRDPGGRRGVGGDVGSTVEGNRFVGAAVVTMDAVG